MDGPEVLLTPTAHPYHLFTSLVLMSHLLLLIAVSGLANRRGEGKFRLLIHGWTKTSAHVECSPKSAFCLVLPYLCLICYQQLFAALLTIGGGGKLIVLIHGWTRTSAHFECSPTSSFNFIHPCLAFYYQFYQLCYQLGARVNISKSLMYGPELLLISNAPSFLLLFRYLLPYLFLICHYWFLTAFLTVVGVAKISKSFMNRPELLLISYHIFSFFSLFPTCLIFYWITL